MILRIFLQFAQMREDLELLNWLKYSKQTEETVDIHQNFKESFHFSKICVRMQ